MLNKTIEHLLKVVNTPCTTDLAVQRPPFKSHASPGPVERAARLVENSNRTVLFDVQERTHLHGCCDSLYGFFWRLIGSPYRFQQYSVAFDG